MTKVFHGSLAIMISWCMLLSLAVVTGFSPFRIPEIRLTHSNQKSFGLVKLLNAELESDSDGQEENVIKEEFDFEAAFRKRVDEEGGVAGLERKSSTRKVIDTANAIVEDAGKVSSSVKSSLSPSIVDEVEDFTLQSVILFFILLIAGGALFSFAMGAPLFTQPFETTEDGRALMFGV
mmetsp:Transcript_26787/g.39628  ORF Transcript_26787/g.39628 Transcript_26787/m.39628 type:complete len:178 (+) Transcript_26787:60-593(+)